MKNLLGIFFVLLTSSAIAGQDWELVSVTRGASWEVNQAADPLKQIGKILEGVLKDNTDGKNPARKHIPLHRSFPRCV